MVPNKIPINQKNVNTYMRKNKTTQTQRKLQELRQISQQNKRHIMMIKQTCNENEPQTLRRTIFRWRKSNTGLVPSGNGGEISRMVNTGEKAGRELPVYGSYKQEVESINIKKLQGLLLTRERGGDRSFALLSNWTVQIIY